MMTTAEQIPFQLILNSGNARSFAMEALQFAKQGKMAEADEAMVKAKEAINEAHHFQTELIQSEARGEKTEISVLLIHAQDHLMNSITVKELAAEFIDLYKKLEAKGE
ncbi:MULTISPECIES: PTS lactose/cellobiose transporter subunit IIA [Bacillus]|jgi:PTS system cellobiose-specific IIA component|uniref:PTS lactose/cellobiose transporter subunit IIA n=15 Tax=Bacillaceae TaxID=186817 RepID=A0A2B4Z6Z3_9BACI|nr:MULTISPECIES: PTS lactose/cellobiose transporter subunit IIA [Bacillus]EEL03548.1 PTS system, lichenan oligosaccharide-specific IIA component [Bacillus cereus BDRD-ST196]EEL37880.1 PTS system, lichenan oligosaccharide-specific IIA component [Bacillus cereus Rock3-29]EEL85336.1 PTS system, lichenan oligosaccharide-specific IIA component [Bacillus cereus AH1272]EEL91144.1 PTS system, lichenan oligosaccharide-specific IIA component [Bacillus cereus AH1273]EJQ16254.1 PTS system, lactose-specifi